MEKTVSRTAKRILMSMLGILLSVAAMAQSAMVRGVVTDSSGEALIGVSVLEKGTQNAAITDINGKFSIKVPGNATLVLTSIGFEETTVKVNNRQDLTIVMEDNSAMLNEVVVVGYGTMRKSDLTGSVGSMNAKDFKDVPVSNIGQALQGKVAGLQVIDAGKPGDNVSMKIRGLGSINDCDPLVVIDGVPTDLGLNNLNMADIERLDVLKDASATAIYGSRGANGVVMITTKKGKEGAGHMAVSADMSFQSVKRKPTMLNSAQYAQLNNEMMANAGYSQNPEWLDPSVLTQTTNWLDEMLRDGIMQNYSLSYSGGTDKAHYYVSGGFLDQTGIVKTVDYRRFTFQANTDAQATKWLKFTNSVKFSADRKQSGSYSISDAMFALPIYAIKDANGEWTGPEGNSYWYGSIRNPIGNMETYGSKTNGYNFMINTSAELTFTKWLKFKSTFGYDAKFWFDDSFSPAYNWKPSPVDVSSRYQGSNRSFTYLWDNYFTIDHTFAKKHHVNAMLGTSAQWNDFAYLNANKSGFPLGVHEMNNGEKMKDISGSCSDWSLLSYMARLNYSYADRYMITGTVRRDGSSRFGKNNRWGTFPSVAAAWRISEESFFPKQEIVNNAKLRLGYGVTGSQTSVSNYSYLAQYNTSVYPFGYNKNEATALVNLALANPNIHWEEVAQTNIGLDLSFLNSRINLSVDAYWKNTSDMLVKASIPITSGFEDTSTTYTNAGKVSNQGVEITLNTVNIQTKDLTWETSANVTFNRNKIKDLNSDTPYYINQLNNSYVSMLAKDYPINVFYGYVTDGIFQNQDEVEAHAFQAGAQPGDIRFKDLDNNGVINDNDRTVIGNPNPSVFYSMTNTLTWKGFELSVFLQGVAGNKIYNYVSSNATGMFAAYNQTTDVLNRWTGEGTSNTMPRAVYGDPNQNARVSDRYVENGAYLRLKNVSLAYNFPKAMLSKIGVEGIRLHFAAENLATITGYSGLDPEVGINGIDYNNYPVSRTFSVGLNVNF